MLLLFVIWRFAQNIVKDLELFPHNLVKKNIFLYDHIMAF